MSEAKLEINMDEPEGADSGFPPEMEAKKDAELISDDKPADESLNPDPTQQTDSDTKRTTLMGTEGGEMNDKSKLTGETVEAMEKMAAAAVGKEESQSIGSEEESRGQGESKEKERAIKRRLDDGFDGENGKRRKSSPSSSIDDEDQRRCLDVYDVALEFEKVG